MTYRADFEVFQPKDSGKLVAYATFDTLLVQELRRNTSAKIGDRNGRKAWTIDADSRTVANFRAAIAAAAERAVAKPVLGRTNDPTGALADIRAVRGH